MASAAQDQWEEIAAAVRAQLAKAAELMPAMTVEELGRFVIAVDDAQWLETKAASYDEMVDGRRREMTRDAICGD